MAEIRIGHDQIRLEITSMEFRKGSLQLTAFGYPDWRKVQNLTGSQPLMLVGNDGNIVGTWHADVTEELALPRKIGPRLSSMTFHQELKFESISIL